MIHERFWSPSIDMCERNTAAVVNLSREIWVAEAQARVQRAERATLAPEAVHLRLTVVFLIGQWAAGSGAPLAPRHAARDDARSPHKASWRTLHAGGHGRGSLQVPLERAAVHVSGPGPAGAAVRYQRVGGINHSFKNARVSLSRPLILDAVIRHSRAVVILLRLVLLRSVVF